LHKTTKVSKSRLFVTRLTRKKALLATHQLMTQRRDTTAAAAGNVNRDVSPLPAPTPQKPIARPRESLDGDTIFAVGEDDKWSDDEDMEPASPDGDERRGLTRKSD